VYICVRKPLSLPAFLQSVLRRSLASAMAHAASHGVIQSLRVLGWRILRGMTMRWLRLAGSLKFQVSSEKETYERDYIPQKRPIILMSLPIEAPPIGGCSFRKSSEDEPLRCPPWEDASFNPPRDASAEDLKISCLFCRRDLWNRLHSAPNRHSEVPRTIRN